MFRREDKTYDELREKSISQWLDEMSLNDDVVVRGGVKVTRDYIDDLKNKIVMLEQKNTLKDKYLKKLKAEKHK